ncbi:uncharacterized protein LOC116338859 [Contarinia nasturtii]|uniref:uncharacterized protein LOC116338859 n=1 Tax=Contarinia nasturtii TaxID=265458 RepID=UPI0012D38753|nr:uncharacterized protein LOC116338859 [Contarinia nasturtii]
MEQFLFLTSLSIFILNLSGAYGQTTYAEILTTFQAKSTLDVLPLFTLCKQEIVPKVTLALDAVFKINLHTEIDPSSRNERINDLIRNQVSMNILIDAIKGLMPQTTAYMAVPLEINSLYQDWQQTMFTQEQFQRIINQLSVVRNIQRNMGNAFVIEMNEIAKKVKQFKTNSRQILAQWKIREETTLGPALDSYIAQENEILEHLEKGKRVMTDYIERRNLWIKFLMGVDTAV